MKEYRPSEVAMLARRVIFLVLFVSLACAKKEEPQPAAQPAPSPSAAAPAQTAPPPAASTASAPAVPAAAAGEAAPAGPSVATAEGETPGLSVTVRELKRGSGGTISLKFTMVNGTDKKVGFNYAYADKEHDVADYDTVGGIHLIDPVGKKKYFVARDSEGKCVCSQKLPEILPGKSLNLWAKFPAPPDDVQKISLVIPHFSPMDDVPIGQ
jgi:hypothetical protein